MQAQRPIEPPSGHRRDRSLAIGASVAAHIVVLAAVLAMRTPLRMMVEPAPPVVALVNLPHLDSLPAPRPGAPERPAGAAAPTKANIPARPTPSTDIKPIAAAEHPAPVAMAGMSETELAGAATAGSGEGGGGTGGGGCNMIRRLQEALRKDRLVQAAVAGPETSGKALRVWDGDWVQQGGQEGRGLAAIREAIIWEIGFAPEACRSQPVHGLVLLSLNDAPGATRLALGAEAWRWTDLLHPKSGIGR